jgi:hypothetical protein
MSLERRLAGETVFFSAMDYLLSNRHSAPPGGRRANAVGGAL